MILILFTLLYESTANFFSSTIQIIAITFSNFWIFSSKQ